MVCESGSVILMKQEGPHHTASMPENIGAVTADFNRAQLVQCRSIFKPLEWWIKQNCASELPFASV
jgi:hypothetical protein